MSAPANPLGNNPAASPEVTDRYCKLFLEYKLAVNGAHFSAHSAAKTLSGAPLWEWKPPADAGLEGFAAASSPPLLALLAAQRLPPDLAQHLGWQQAPPGAQQQQQQQQQQQERLQ